MFSTQPAPIDQTVATSYGLRQHDKIECKEWRADQDKLLNDLTKLYTMLWNQWDPRMK